MASTSFDLLYDVLGLECFASLETVRAAYKKLRIKYHPDSNYYTAVPGMFGQLREAYTVLGDSTKKKYHDTILHHHLTQAIHLNIIISEKEINENTHDITIYSTDKRIYPRMQKTVIRSTISNLHWDKNRCSQKLILNAGFFNDDNTAHKTNVYITYSRYL